MKTRHRLSISWIAVIVVAFGLASAESSRVPRSVTANHQETEGDRSKVLNTLVNQISSKENSKELTHSQQQQQQQRPHNDQQHQRQHASNITDTRKARPEVDGLNRRLPRRRRAAEKPDEPVAPSSGKWSIPRANIIDGDISLPSRWEWSVALVSEQYGIGFVCGATIIRLRWVITAAHCVYSATGPIYALIGAWNLTANDYKDRILVQEIIVHPGFELRQTSTYDIALLKLERDANVTNNPEEILTLPNLLFNLFELNPNCYIIGWGVTEPGSTMLSTILRQKRVNVISSVECQRRWDQGFMPVEIAHTNLCIDEGANGDISACFGDSGSPLQCYDISDGVWKLAGLSSWGSSSCSTYPSVYAKVQAFLDWIYATIVTPRNLFDRNPRNPDPDDGK